MLSDWQFLRRLGFWPSFFVHFFLAVLGSIAIGFLPEAFVGHLYYNTGLEPYSPMILVAAGCLGFSLNQRLGQPAACWVWIIGILWLSCGALEESTYWYNSVGYSSRMQYVLGNFFGRTSACSGSECLAEFFFTTPCAASIVYSVAAGVGLKSYRRSRHDESELPPG